MSGRKERSVINGKKKRKVRKKRDVWEIVNRGRRKRKRVNENIKKKE